MMEVVQQFFFPASHLCATNKIISPWTSDFCTGHLEIELNW